MWTIYSQSQIWYLPKLNGLLYKSSSVRTVHKNYLVNSLRCNELLFNLFSNKITLFIKNSACIFLTRSILKHLKMILNSLGLLLYLHVYTKSESVLQNIYQTLKKIYDFFFRFVLNCIKYFLMRFISILILVYT